MSEEKRPFDGLKVLDFTWGGVGPFQGNFLAYYGAMVIRVESAARPDITRQGGGIDPRPLVKEGAENIDRKTLLEYGPTFALTHPVKKYGMSLNITNPKGVEIFKKLAAWADVLVESFTTGTLERRGLGYEELKKINPRLIMHRTCGYGHTGPMASQPGYGQVVTSLTGFYTITGWPDREPVGPSGPYTDFIAPHFNTFALLAALDYRRRTGKGQYLDFAQHENAVHFIAPLLLDYAVNRREANRMGNRYHYAAPHGAYRCRGEDRWCAIAVFTEEEWRSFCRVIGNPSWTDDSRFGTLLARKENEEELNRLVEEWTINYSAEEVMNLMQAAGVGAGVVESSQDILEHDPQLKHRHFFWELDHPEIGKHRLRGHSFVLSKSPYEVRRAPLLGEHNEYALKELLGMSDDEIAELVIEGVLE